MDAMSLDYDYQVAWHAVEHHQEGLKPFETGQLRSRSLTKMILEGWKDNTWLWGFFENDEKYIVSLWFPLR